MLELQGGLLIVDVCFHVFGVGFVVDLCVSTCFVFVLILIVITRLVFDKLFRDLCLFVCLGVPVTDVWF